ncbi:MULTISPECIES: hypothetical protein [unclassified Exiguobacterium]|uniref:hypothetical protein n=1 Tax=unclassified Exiguobacterium TaxID=2644629 RepID=UPI0005132564|nr:MULTISPECIES: hypothetical protein [unclassified Exiguobacterium]KGI84751.1 hypothetical protein JY98_00435 [Exiguobacterium mexicanum]
MIGVSIATKWEYEATLEHYDVKADERFSYPYGEYFMRTVDRAVVMWNDYLELKEHGVTIADTEAGAIAYICKKNDVECIIIKGISDFPTDERDANPVESNAEQINVYIANTPKVMTKIFDDYLMRFL